MSVTFFARNSRAGNGRANFVGASGDSFTTKLVLSPRKPPLNLVFFFLGGGGIVLFCFGGEGESANFIFMGAGISLIITVYTPATEIAT